MLYLYQSNRLEHLFDLLATVLGRQPLASPFEQETVIVQSRGMGRWLNFRLAQQQGIAANLRYPLPASFFWEVLNRMLGAQAARSAFSPEVLTFRILRWLEQPANLQGAQALAHYLSDGGDFRRYELASRLADVFDQYLIYRPDWLQAWQTGLQPLAAADATWQARLWRDLVADTPDAHRAASLTHLLQMLQRGEGVDRLPQRISLVGISSLPPVYLELLKQLGQHMDVAFFALNPCAVPWGDIRDVAEQARISQDADPADLYLEVGNSLLAAWGKQGRDFFASLADVPQLFDVFDEPDPQPASLLQCLQQDVLALIDRSACDPYVVQPDDRSVQVHVCHGPMREVEVLHDQLLALFNADSSLQPADVVVLTPDIERYAPFIDAVFAPHPGVPTIPYSIADRSEAASSPLVQAFLSLLGLPDSRFPADFILGLLDHPAIRARFGIEESDLPRIQHWVADTRTYWARDARHKAAFDLPPTAQNSWREGLARMLLGCALPQTAASDGLPLYHQLLPYDEIEGAQSQCVARLAAMVEALFAQADALAAARPLSYWADTLAAMCDALLQAEDEPDIAVLQHIRERLQDLRELSAIAGHHAPIDLAAVRAWLAGQMESRSTGGGFLTGGVTFCTMVPMRSLPFRVICVLGMDDATFPRRLRPQGFDLISRYPRFGDRSRRADDRFLFLETLLSARDVFYLSYVGRDNRSDTELPSSILVNDLLAAVAKSCVTPANALDPARRTASGRAVVHSLQRQHPLQPFDGRYFSGDPAMPGFHSGWARAASLVAQSSHPSHPSRAPLFSAPLSPPDSSWQSVERDALCEFLQHPTRYLLQRRCGLGRAAGHDGIDCSEPFSLPFNDVYAVRQLTLETLQQGYPMQHSAAWARASGILPHGYWGDREFAREAAVAQHLYRHARRWLSSEPLAARPWRVASPGGLELTGWLDGLRPEGRVVVLTSKAAAYYLMPAWIDHLALCLLQPDGIALRTTVIADDGVFAFSPVAAAEPLLRDLLACYWQGLQHPLPLFRKSSAAYAEVLARSIGQDDTRKALQAASARWLGNEFSDAPSGERLDPWLQMAWGELPVLDDHFDALARKVWLPVYQHLSQIQDQ